MALSLEEASDLVHLIGRNFGKQVLSAFNVVSQDQSLIREQRCRKLVAHHPNILVAEINSFVSLQVAEQIHGLVELCYVDDLFAEEITEASRCCEEECVADPLTTLY